MTATVLGISGSPIPDSNTDRAVKTVLEHTGLPSEFIKLNSYKLEPCQACLGCVNSNMCVVEDDGRLLAEKFQSARAFVLGGYTPYSSLDARTKTFMERMYCLRHKEGLNRGKIGAAVITTACEPGKPGLPPAADTTAAQIAFWMMEEGMTNLGTVVILGNVPCIRCGHGDSCEMSGVRMLHGPDATVASVGVSTFDVNARSMSLAMEMGRRIRAAVLSEKQAG
ncbi:MAG: flavodoxin family protein [Phycisphaeraceae bacterium]|nr:flavodoxin family protein [Phycisphaeraceae bacterium]